MTYDVRSVLVGVLHQLRAPVNDANMLALEAWHACEGGSAAYNPLNTTQWQPGATNYNSFGPGGAYHVRNYPDAPTGVRATVLTLTNGHYPTILAALREGQSAYGIVRGHASRELDVWGTGGGHVKAWLDAHHAGDTRPPVPAPRPRPHTPHPSYIVQPGDTLDAIAKRYRLRGGWQELYTANRSIVGPNPNVIRPGEHLSIPSP